ncbi:MAG TPA: tetratricopeptide repeat protein, partial [Herpetosiphonaceae bacterium]
APPLDDGASPDPCALAIADALGLVLQGARPPARQLQTFLQDKQLLLVLDNFEHLLAASDLLLDLLRQAPQLKLLVTSRERLNLYEEQVLELGGLGVPPEDAAPDQADSFGAIQLFCQQAQRVSLGWEPQPGDGAHLARICRLLDGMPLGIELAASWVRVMPCQAIAEQVAQGLDFLTSTFRNLPERHRSLRGVFEHSWRLLAPHERRALANIAVFRGGFSRAAAQQVADASLADLAALSDKSLIRRADERFEVHELLRQYAHEHLAATRTVGALQERHMLHYLALLARQAGPLRGGDQLGALLEIGQELENVRAAWGWAVRERQAKPLAAALDGLFHFFDTRSRFQEGAALLQAALDAGPQEGGELFRARLMARQGWLLFQLGQPARARELLGASLELLDALGAPAETVFNLAYLGAISRHEGNYAQAEALLTLALERAAAAGDRWGQSVALNILGQVASLRGDFALARERCEHSLGLKRAIDDRWGMTFSLIYLGRVEQALGNQAATEALFRESLALSRDFGDRRGAAFALQNLGDALRQSGDAAQAAKLYQQSLELYQAIGARREASLTWSRLGLAAGAGADWAAADQAFSQALQLALASESRTATQLAVESLALSGAEAAAGAASGGGRPPLADDLQALLGSARAALGQGGA